MDQSSIEIQDQLVALLPRLRRFARTLTRNVHDADDLVQLAIERALVRIDQWRVGSRLDSWVFGIIHHAWIDEVRARRRQEHVIAPEQAADQVADAASEAPLERLSLAAAFAQLPEDQRVAVTLVLVEGLAYKEAAAVLDVPIGTVTSRIARGRETLQTLLGGGRGDHA